VNRVIYPDSGAGGRRRDEIVENVGDDRNKGGKVAFVECLSLGSAALQGPGRIEPSSSFHVVPRAPAPWTTLFKPKKRQRERVRRLLSCCTQTFSTSD
jgi:hypothetical protein